jgi:hypothetical protein
MKLRLAEAVALCSTLHADIPNSRGPPFEGECDESSLAFRHPPFSLTGIRSHVQQRQHSFFQALFNARRSHGARSRIPKHNWLPRSSESHDLGQEEVRLERRGMHRALQPQAHSAGGAGVVKA